MKRIQTAFRTLTRLAIGLVMAGLSSSANAQVSICEADFDRVHAIGRNLQLSEQDNGEQLAASYRESQFLPSETGHHDSVIECARFRLRAATYVGAYLNDAQHFEAFSVAFHAAEALGVANKEDREAMFKALIGLRRFEDAREYLAKYPDLAVESPVPAVLEADARASGPMAYAIADKGTTLAPMPYDLGSGTRLVVITHPLCAFSRRAMEALAGDDGLSSLLGPIIWLTPVDQTLNLSTLSEWNEAHPQMPMVIAKSRADWPFVDQWATPVFYVLKDGALTGKLVGWPAEGNRQALMALLARSMSADMARTDPVP